MQITSTPPPKSQATLFTALFAVIFSMISSVFAQTYSPADICLIYSYRDTYSEKGYTNWSYKGTGFVVVGPEYQSSLTNPNLNTQVSVRQRQYASYWTYSGKSGKFYGTSVSGAKVVGRLNLATAGALTPSVRVAFTEANGSYATSSLSDNDIIGSAKVESPYMGILPGWFARTLVTGFKIYDVDPSADNSNPSYVFGNDLYDYLPCKISSGSQTFSHQPTLSSAIPTKTDFAAACTWFEAYLGASGYQRQ